MHTARYNTNPLHNFQNLIILRTIFNINDNYIPTSYSPTGPPKRSKRCSLQVMT